MKCALRDTMIAAWLLDTDSPSLALGALASLAGLGAGIGFAQGLAALFAASGIQLPTAGLVICWCARARC